MTRTSWRAALGVASLALLPAAAAAQAASPLAGVERSYQSAREMKDAMDVARARGVVLVEGGDSIAAVARRYAPAVRQFDSLLRSIDSTALDTVDRRALRTMRRTAATELNADSATAAAPDTAPPDCRYDPAAIAALKNGLDSLSTRMYACYGYAAQHVTYGAEHVDRLTILGRLTGTESAAERERLFRALTPVFQAMNGDDGASSPYRTMVLLSAQRWKERGSPVDAAARLAGVDPSKMEGWLVSILDRWREVSLDSMIEPWDYDYLAGHADRMLDRLVKARGGLAALNAAYFRSLGADVDTLQVRFDLGAREGKTPVAYTTFGRRGRLDGGRWITGDEWIFATYKFPGIGNLNELLHESGHAVHIAAIRTRPAFFDWPDDDAFTEGLADIAALEVYEPVWQAKWLGDSVPLAEAMRARYSAIMMDACWALFEIRMHADPAQDPNAVWSGITSRYLHIKAHPDLSWWARRGQLVDLPGYMANYAIGAIIIADIRARLISQHGDFAKGDPTWYGWVAPRLYRYGLERSSKQVIEDFLGRPLSPQALLDDLERMAPAKGVRRD